MDGVAALRLDDVGAASKQHEVYGVTRLALGPLRLPFPGNVLFLKYLPPVKRWGPYRELTAPEWDGIVSLLERAGARMTVAVTAGWVERSGSVVPFPRKFPEAAAVIRAATTRGVLEIANHGYTHCLLDGGRFRPRAFAGNREYHREFYAWLPEARQRDHLARAQEILETWAGVPVVTFVPPGNLFSPTTLAAAEAVGLRFVSCRDAARHGSHGSLVFVDDRHVTALHDRDVVAGGLAPLRRALTPPASVVTVRELGERLMAARP